jgi:hypothetical protein
VALLSVGEERESVEREKKNKQNEEIHLIRRFTIFFTSRGFRGPLPGFETGGVKFLLT